MARLRERPEVTAKRKRLESNGKFPITSSVGRQADASRLKIASPTIAELRAQGVRGVFVMCANLKCRHLGTVAFEAISETPIRERRRPPGKRA
jgi:hypothetical protein